MTTPSKQDEQNVKAAQMLRAVFEEMQTPLYRERKRFLAAEKLNTYRAYVAAGFTEAQALELCKGAA